MSRSDEPRTVNAEGDSLDQAIERTLREMVALDPPDRLTARVMAQVGQSRREAGPRGGFGWWPVAGALAAAAVLAIAVALWPDRTQPPASRSAAATPAPAPAQAQQPQAPLPQPPQAANAARTIRGARSGRYAPAQETALPTLEPSIAIAPLEAPASIALADLTLEDVTVAPIEVPKMEIAPLERPDETGIRK